MKKVLLSFFLLLISVSNYAQYSWLALPNAPTSWRCDDVYFLNANIGWSIHAYYDYLTPNQYGQVYKTWDGGNTWILMHDSSKSFYRCVGFFDSLHGWVGNLADPSITNDTIPLYYTSDGGKTLTPVNLGYPHPKGICGISVVNDSVVYAYGRYISPSGYVKTTDRGNTWAYKDMSAYASVGLIDGWFWSQDTGFITGQNGENAVILHTTDGGNTWQTVYQATRNDTDHVWKIFFPSRNIGYGAIEYLGNNQYFGGIYNTYYVKTIDGGQTWTEYSFIPNYDEEGCGFINDTIGWIGGSSIQPNYITYDGGSTWSPDYGFGINTPPYTFADTGSSINRFRKINDTLMYASGNTVYKLSGKITGINTISNNKYSAKNYPNPFTVQTTIEYSLSQTCHDFKLEVFTPKGQLIFSQNMGTQESGNHQYVFKSSLPNGAYFYRITSDEYTNTQKMVKIK